MAEPSPQLILIADDDASFRDVLIRFCRATMPECTFVPAGDGAEALAQLTAREFAAAVIDVIMPRMTGYEVVLAARGKDIRCPIILMTGLHEAASTLGRHSGADVVLPKGEAEFHFTVVEHLVNLLDARVRDERLERIRSIARRSLGARQAAPGVSFGRRAAEPAPPLGSDGTPIVFIVGSERTEFQRDTLTFLELLGFADATRYAVAACATLGLVRTMVERMAPGDRAQALVILDAPQRTRRGVLAVARQLRLSIVPPVEVVVLFDDARREHVTTAFQSGIHAILQPQRDEFLPAIIERHFAKLGRPLPAQFAVNAGFVGSDA